MSYDNRSWAEAHQAMAEDPAGGCGDDDEIPPLIAPIHIVGLPGLFVVGVVVLVGEAVRCRLRGSMDKVWTQKFDR